MSGKLVIVILFLFVVICTVLLLIGFEGMVGNIVEEKRRFIWVFQNQIFSIFEFHAGVDYTPEDTPRVIHIQVGLIGELFRFELLCPQNRMS